LLFCYVKVFHKTFKLHYTHNCSAEKEKGERRLNKNNPLLIMLIVAMFAVLLVPAAPVNAWTYPDGSEDTLYEEFGPRADKILIKLYEAAEPMWDAFIAGEIDMFDWPLTKDYKDLMDPDPDINVVSYGPEFGLFIIDINNNPNEYLGNPQDPEYPNPVYPNPCSVIPFRQAIAHLADRGQLDGLIGTGYYFPMYTPVPPSMGDYVHPEIVPGGALEDLTYPYDPVAAAALLDANGFPINPDTGWRFWDMNGDGVEQPEEYLELKFFIRSDHPHRRDFGTWLAGQLESVGVRVNEVVGTITAAWFQVFRDKDFHLYTGGWGLGVDPDHLILWNSYFYWHPGFCYNYAFVNDPELDGYIWGVIYANTFEEAKINAWKAQERFAEIAASIPLWTYSGFKAIRKTYSGGTAGSPVTPDDGENKYRGLDWLGVVNIDGYGLDNGYTFLNLYPNSSETQWGDGGNMTIRYAFKTLDIRMLNPLYAEWVWDWIVLGMIYDSLLTRNPYNLAEIKPWLASDYKVDIYEHPIYGTCTKVRFTLRDDIFWADGTPLTVADVMYTFVEMDDDLAAVGLPPPWWYANVMDILSFSILDPYNFEVLLAVKSVFAVMWPGGNIVLPKHIWKPIILGPDLTPGTDDDGTYETVHGFAPDPNLIGSGPWRLVEYVANSHVLMTANIPGSTVQTNIEGSVPITSPMGYFRQSPFDMVTAIIDPPELAGLHKYPPDVDINMTIVDVNLWAQPLTYLSELYINETLLQSETLTLLPFERIENHKLRGRFGCYRDVGWWEFNGTHINIWKVWYIHSQGVWVCDTVYIPECEWFYIVKHIEFEAWDSLKSKLKQIEGIPIIWEISWWQKTIREDIAGSNWYNDVSDAAWLYDVYAPEDIIGYLASLYEYPFKDQVPTCDYKVDIFDVALAARSFGSYPGHERWNTVADLNLDYKIDITDIALIAKKFGWVAPYPSP
jgi:peptide/nickel transport system substrate-binding protein